jgi:acyl-CoA synthetase (AMP-forming)/AMP-acid ligase II
MATSTLPPLPTRAGPAAIGAHVTLGALRAAHATAFELLGGPKRSYGELDERTNRLAQALLGRLRPGDRVAIWLDNCLEYMDTYLACVKAGLVIVQVNIRHKAYEARFQLTDSGAAALVYGDAVAEHVEQLGLDLGLVLATGRHRVTGALGFEDFLATGANVLPPEPGDDDLMVIGYTSGTTGFPKGAELTHRSVRTLGQTNAITNRYPMNSVHVFGLSLSFTATIPAHILTHLYVGGTTVLLPSWDTEALVDAIERHRATFTIVPSPPIVEFCELVEANPARVASLVSVLHSASKAPAEHLERMVGAIGPRLVEGWGMTENSGGLVAATTARDYLDKRPGIFDSTGRAAPDAVIELVDPAGELVPHDGASVGQLVCHSASLARGYWNNPEATRETFRDGWYYSGDLGRIDPDGYVTVLDRRPDLIVSGGMNVYPSEVERVILGLPGVAEVAVVGAPHERWGQTPVAYVVPGDPAVTAESVLAYCARTMAGYKKPSRVHLVPELPKNASGKIKRNLLRERAAGA